MDPKAILAEAKALQPELLEARRDLHQHPELGFDLVYTKPFVKSRLEAMGYEVEEVGKAGLVCYAGKEGGKTVLIRGDMDALPINEETEVEFRSLTPGKMHACGHDMHTSMMLGAAKLLKKHESELNGRVKLEFQPAEETFQGSRDMIEAGLLDGVDAAMMIHVAAALPMPSGCIVVPRGGISMASCEQYHITVRGKGGHGSTPHVAIDPITAAAHIHLALQEINSREINGHDFGVFTTCHFEAGKTSNVIPETAEMWGTIRTVDPTNQMGEFIKERMEDIVSGVATALRCQADVEFYDFCPTVVIDDEVSKLSLPIMQELLGPAAIDYDAPPANGSEDFAFVSHKVPTIAMYLTAGDYREGYTYAAHNPKTRFDDRYLFVGTAAYAYFAARYLEKCV